LTFSGARLIFDGSEGNNATGEKKMLERPFNDSRQYPYPIGPEGPYTVLYWGSHPNAGNDDCYAGEYFLTRAEALNCFRDDCHDYYVAYVEIDGPDCHEIRRNPLYNARRCQRDDAWDRSEAAMQAGMAFGCAGYNDAMGY
jgi:hypothetical protein